MLAALTDAQWGMLTTAGVAVAGIVGQVVIARNRHAHERTMAGDDRRQRRREDTYVELLTQVRMVTRTLYARRVEWAEDEVLDLLESRVAVLGSTEMQDLFDGWRTTVRHADTLTRNYEEYGEGSMGPEPSGPAEAEYFERMEALVGEAETFLAQMEAQANGELSQ